MGLRTRMFMTAKLLTFKVADGGHFLFKANNSRLVMQANGGIILAEWILYAVISALSVILSYIYLSRRSAKLRIKKGRVIISYA